MQDVQRNRYGLTLIEVLVALVIVSVGLFALISTASRCLAVARQAKHYEKARHLLAQVEVENPLALEEEIEETSDSGGFKGEASQYRWQRTISMVSEEEDEEGLYEVTTRVTWSDRGRKAHEEITTYVFAPEEVEGGSFEGPAR